MLHVPRMCYMPRPSHPPLLDHANDICSRVKIIQLITVQFSPASAHFIPIWSTAYILLSTLISDTHSQLYSPMHSDL
jgi:hypothetical protein